MTKTLSPQEQELWNRWHAEQDMEAANELVKMYDHLVSFHVQRISAHLPSSVSKDDIRSLGVFGLFDALRKFDLKRDLKFDTYASFRIRGAIIDGLRKEDWLPRSTRDKAKKIDQITESLEQKLHRPPSISEVAEAVSMTETEVAEVNKDALYANVLSMEEKVKDDGSGQDNSGYTLPDPKTLSPDAKLIQSENHHELAEAILELKENEQLVISLFYNDELTLTEIGQVLDLTTSRISQIHAKALFKLKHILSKL
ncbi:FliA/WhiG family RNA polymerase sigma factor [Thalassobacillus hwangdonensis]|uniref:FliA/WhiG family RNA polymerase sigma factor n=1 Tax=Thalassobacillus hwangdonensis TaxID=546108 RepID=A0ABW3KZH6_9BACI